MEKIKEILPDFYEEMVSSLNTLERNEVVEQLKNITINRHTIDEVEHALYIYTDGVRELNQVEKNIIGVKHKECLELDKISGMVIIDLDNFDRIMGIEVLDRPDVELILLKKEVNHEFK